MPILYNNSRLYDSGHALKIANSVDKAQNPWGISVDLY